MQECEEVQDLVHQKTMKETHYSAELYFSVFLLMADL